MAADAPFDLEAAVAGLLANPKDIALELPPMNAGQQQAALTFIEEQSGLSCETVALGAESRLRVVKVGSFGDDAETQLGSEATAAIPRERSEETLGSEETAACEAESSDDAEVQDGSREAAPADEVAGGEEALNLEAAIVEFCADVQRSSVELPQMTAGQRQFAKKLVEGRPGLKCESYGLGAERRVHIFKTTIAMEGEEHRTEAQHLDPLSPASLAAHAFSVKNTFIDDFTGEERTEPTVCRSTPVQLAGGALSRRHTCPAEPCDRFTDNAEATGSESPEGEVESAESEKSGEAGEAAKAAPSCKHHVPEDVSSLGSTTASPCSSALPSGRSESAPISLPEGIRIMNTFICSSYGQSLDTRTVRSMPHGMFKQNLLEERLAREQATRVTTSAAEPGVLPPGTEVVIQGLTKLPEFNGLIGTVQCLDEEAGRYDILLPSAVELTGQKWAKVKRENLRVAAQPQPPCHAPSWLHETEEGEVEPFPDLSPDQSPDDVPPLQLPPYLPAVDRSQLAVIGVGLGGLDDFGGRFDVGLPLAPFGSQDWSWCGIQSSPAWELTGTAPLPISA